MGIDSVSVCDVISDTHQQRSRRHRLWLTAAARRSRIIYCNTQETANINPFTAPACKISGLKDARTRLQTVYVPVL